jgi:hypothetical protein
MVCGISSHWGDENCNNEVYPGPARQTRLPSGEPKFAGDCGIPAEGKTMFSRFASSIRIVTAKTQIKKLSSSGEPCPSLWKRQKRGLSGFRPRESETEVPGRSVWSRGQNDVFPVRAGLCLSLEMAKNEVYPGEAARLA